MSRTPSGTRRPVRIVARPNKVGIARDVSILQAALSPLGAAVTFSPYRSISPFRRYFGSRGPPEILVFLERVTSRWLGAASRTVLIPNQERFPRRLRHTLRRHVDHVFCKSRHAHEIFSEIHESVHQIGFTSEDRSIASVLPDYRQFLHLAGGSSLKGTEEVLAVWADHPEWPTLTLLWHRPGSAPAVLPENVRLIDWYLPDGELRRLQNACGIHLCPSRSEGWGHYIVEALSCGAVTVTTDGPPMNELVTSGRGVLVPWVRSEPRKMGTNFYVDGRGLEEAVDGILSKSQEELGSLGRSARRWYEENDARFRSTILERWHELEL